MKTIISTVLFLLSPVWSISIESSAYQVLELTHNPHVISTSRWENQLRKNTSFLVKTFQEERIEESYKVQEELNEDWARRRRRRRLGDEAKMLDSESTAPLFEGIGTHYAYIYIGTPPQRVTVIVDTGSHHTAFPCLGCSNCGKHTDPYYEPTKSSSNKVLPCSQCQGGARCSSNKKCEFSQSYTEGSSWKAIQMQDLMWVGGLSVNEEPVAHTSKPLAVPFLFGCQFSETGLFRTQKADGIMGLSINSLTLVPTLVAHNLLPVKAFSLCFSRTGGMMMLGGANTATVEEPIKFIPLSKKSSWFTVHLYDIRIQAPNKDISHGSIGVKESVLNSGKGVIVDSGTTDTYLPRALASQFKATFKKAAKRDYSNSRMTLNEKDFNNFPTIVFVFKDSASQEVAIKVKPSAYLEKQGSDRYVPRIYLTEGSGAVLGANFMQDQMVLFDEENSRVGIGRANCEYQNYINSNHQNNKKVPDNSNHQNNSTSKMVSESDLDMLQNDNTPPPLLKVGGDLSTSSSVHASSSLSILSSDSYFVDSSIEHEILGTKSNLFPAFLGAFGISMTFLFIIKKLPKLSHLFSTEEA
mmetsp:Transcript_6059/g.7843  ORF Transcript_6059/g.7843 Transcript_6059/m.7843 type:complete len:582 (-) Transcript_6059:290-2035(-)